MPMPCRAATSSSGTGRGRNPDRETLRGAAAVAAYHSKARRGRNGAGHHDPGPPCDQAPGGRRRERSRSGTSGS